MTRTNCGILIVFFVCLKIHSVVAADTKSISTIRNLKLPIASNNVPPPAMITFAQPKKNINEFDDSTKGNINISSIQKESSNKNPSSRINHTSNVTSISLDTSKSSKISANIKRIINNHITLIDWQGLNNIIRSPAEVRTLYRQTNFQPLWLENGKITELAKQVIKATKNANYHALRPETYHSFATSSLRAGQQVAEPAKFDIIISDAFITFKSHLTNGIVPPKKQFLLWNEKKQDIDFLSLYLKSQAINNISDVFTVNDPEYQVLQKAYKDQINSDTIENFIPIPEATLKPKQSGLAVRILRTRLGLDNHIDVYDNELKEAVRHYQEKNGLGIDGIVGINTLKHLNRSPADILQILVINMERHRWNNLPTENYIWVNIPAFRMSIRNGNKKLFESNIIVGRPKRQTPIFSDTLESVVLAPYWNIPKTIFREDKLPQLQKNPNALGPKMQIIDTETGEIVTASSVDWSKDSKGYRLRQKPGPKNALGGVKFLFPNKYAIYLHDTPKRKLFKKNIRAFSSGCVRVERAYDLAVFLLKDMGYDKKRIEIEGQRKKERWITLNKNRRYPIFLKYYTVWANNNGKVYYSNDIYGFDENLKKLYKDALNAL